MSMRVSPDVRCAVPEVLIDVTKTNLVTARNVDQYEATVLGVLSKDSVLIDQYVICLCFVYYVYHSYNTLE